ncbi:hypothetical protein GE09DRAFT_1280905 [Coniochaeta sp. 2T2.1]|nr:hypothetical protein GE09DRAFT_1280905 [Coniochaeta sp. 2T2.1]
MGYFLLHRKWRVRKPMYWLMAAELVGLVPILVLFGIQQPDLYRTKFWQIGYNEGLNSNPNMILYAYANHRPLPKIPLVWSSVITEFNVAISVISLFVLLTKMIGFIMRVWYPIVGLFFNTAMVALYATSIYGQAGPDYADPRFPSPVAWYIRYGCDIAVKYGAKKQCMMAKGTFGVTTYMLFLYVANLGLAIWAMLPNKELDISGDDDDDDDYSPAENKSWEMQPRTPGATPFTPRTQAFHTLDRKLPLRSQYA